MNLYQMSSGILNNTYTNESGQAIYKVSTPHKFSGRVTTISRIVPSDYEPPRVEDTTSYELGSLRKCTPARSDSDGSSIGREPEVDFRDRFAPLGYIDWKVFASSVMRYKGEEVKATTYLKKQGWGSYGRNRVFKGPDGKEYKWILGSSIPELILNDGSKTLIARFHTRKLGVFSPANARPAYLEILPDGEHMVDVIFFTFIYIEKIRKEQERNSAAA
ncbi:uncharacterized protein EV420DRAFT_1311985 [Desarmillaria tabescens]|uniref:DUF6593 domain-containing protein n=1 Tax=Armillaria tabescens TaxID=1929756 RepID=A0AA39JZA1_ARMTA|nr:uncharacterized protein EV420DRAFT_1311985 [Desarmillaria tabescens]KAK0451407.1 hypothetical protein EV420DRAFT_1311985 [Desarmillaria tabescens]